VTDVDKYLYGIYMELTAKKLIRNINFYLIGRSGMFTSYNSTDAWLKIN